MSEEKKRESHPEIWILLAMGIKPQTLIAKGYSKATVYKYSREIPRIKDRIDTLFEEGR